MTYMVRPAFAFVLAALPLGIASAAAPIGYAQATGYFKKDSRPTLYQPLNLLDGREATAWCTTGPDPLNDQLTFGFKGPVQIDEIRIYTGNGFDESTFKEFSRAKKLAIKGPSGARTLGLADQRGQQAIALSPPLEGEQFTVEVLDLFPAEDPEMPVCITDVVFYADGKPLNGPWLTRELKYDRARAGLLGTWFAGSEGAPDRYLSFYFDGTYRFVYQPWDPSMKGKSWNGDYDPSATRLTLKLPGKGRVTARLQRDGATSDSGHDLKTLVLDGNVPEDLKKTFRDRM